MKDFKFQLSLSPGEGCHTEVYDGKDMTEGKPEDMLAGCSSLN